MSLIRWIAMILRVIIGLPVLVLINLEMVLGQPHTVVSFLQLEASVLKQIISSRWEIRTKVQKFGGYATTPREFSACVYGRE